MLHSKPDLHSKGRKGVIVSNRRDGHTKLRDMIREQVRYPGKGISIQNTPHFNCEVKHPVLDVTRNVTEDDKRSDGKKKE